MLKRARTLFDRVDVKPRLVREGVTADEGLAIVKAEVCRLANSPRNTRKARHILCGYAIVAQLQLKHGKDGGEICVSAPLAYARYRALSLRRPCRNCGNGARSGPVMHAVVKELVFCGSPLNQ